MSFSWWFPTWSYMPGEKDKKRNFSDKCERKSGREWGWERWKVNEGEMESEKKWDLEWDGKKKGKKKKEINDT